MKKKNGFTLVEVLVTITILGIVTLVALPVINVISGQLNEKKLETYKGIIESGAKLYADSHDVDLFGFQKNGCKDIYYTTLVANKSIEELDFSKQDVIVDKIFVRVIKINGNYNYETYIPTSSTLSTTPFNSCETSVSESGPIVSFEPDGTTKYVKNTSTEIVVKDGLGISPNAKITYQWYHENETPIGTEVKHDFRNIITNEVRLKVDTPTGLNEKIYLQVKATDLRDEGGFVTSKDKLFKSKLFKLDNTAPTIVIDAYKANGTNRTGNILKTVNNINLVINEWQKYGYYFDFTRSSDNSDVGNKGIKKEEWAWNTSGKNTLNKELTSGYRSYTPITNHTLTGTGARYGSLRLCDEANNCNTKSVQVLVSNYYYFEYKPNGGSGKMDNTTCYYGFACNLSDCKFGKTGYHHSKWVIDNKEYNAGDSVKNFTEENGKKYTATVKWEPNKYTIKYDGNGSSSGSTSSTTCTYDSDCTLNSNGFSKTGYTFDGWSINSKDYNAGKSVKNLTDSGTITAYANWKIKTYTISYNCNGGSGCPGSQTKTYGTDLTLSGSWPYRSGWEFLGYNTSASSTSGKYSPGGTYSSNSGETLYAIWRRKVTVHFNVNKCGWISNTSKSCYYYNDQTSCTITSPGISNIPGNNKDGTAFSDWLKIRGWNTDSNATSSSYNTNTDKSFSSDHTYYAIATLESGYSSRKWIIISDIGLIVRQRPYWNRTGTMHTDTYCNNHGSNEWAYRDIKSDPLWLRVTQIRGSDDKCGSGDGTGDDDNCDGWSSATYLRPV